MPLGFHLQVTALTTRKFSPANREVSKRHVDRNNKCANSTLKQQPKTTPQTRQRTSASNFPPMQSCLEGELTAGAVTPQRAQGTGDRGTELAEVWEPELWVSMDPATPVLIHTSTLSLLSCILLSPFNSQRADASIKKMPLPCGLLHHNFN